MGDFTQLGIVKAPRRPLATALPPISANIFVNEITGEGNPFETTDCEVAGVAKDGAEKSSESYSWRVVYEDALAKSVGTVCVRRLNQTGFERAMTRVESDTTLMGHMGGDLCS